LLQSTKKHLKIYFKYFKVFLKTRLVYKWDTALSLVNNALSLISAIALILLLFTQIQELNGWSFWELIFLTSFFRMVLGVQTFLFFAPVFLGREFIITGNLDRVLVRPLNSLYQVYVTQINIHNFTEAVGALTVLIIAADKIGTTLTLPKILYGAAASISSIMLLTAIFLALGTFAFWTGKSRSFFSLIWRVRDFSQFPFGIYPTAIKTFLVTLMPVAFASYFPATFLLGKPANTTLQLLTLIAGPTAFITSYMFWLYGVSKYSSTGS
jgi:ABC-2 type transport system permease protein